VQLNGIHHITAITADAQANIDFYCLLLGLRLVKQTVNQDDPGAYHLFYADERGSPGADLTFFAYPHAARGLAGAGMVHRIRWRLRSAASLDFWEQRLREHGIACAREQGTLRFNDPEVLAHELAPVQSADDPLLARAPDIPEEHALQGFDGVYAYAADPRASARLLVEGLSFDGVDGGPDRYTMRGPTRGAFYAYDPPPGTPGRQGAGTVHHVAFAAQPAEHEAWRERVIAAGARPTPVIDRYYFRSIYFREPSGVLFELATIGPGFALDEEPEHLGERLSLPPFLEARRAEIEASLAPLRNPRAGAIARL
jgi:glyoxalase family protein